MIKVCSKCSKRKNVQKFYKNRKINNGFTRWCKKCCRISKTKYRKANPEKIKQMARNYYKTPRGKYIDCKKSASRYKKSFNLTFKEFVTFWKKPCFYCGFMVKTIGLDRINSNKGYTRNNLVSCCKMCNFMKRAHSKYKFLSQCLKIVKYQNREV